jgi:hypothetical protein
MAELQNLEHSPKRESDPGNTFYYEVTASTSLGFIADYFSGESINDAKEKMAKKYHLKEDEIDSIKTEPITKEIFVGKIKQQYAMRRNRK